MGTILSAAISWVFSEACLLFQFQNLHQMQESEDRGAGDRVLQVHGSWLKELYHGCCAPRRRVGPPDLVDPASVVALIFALN